MVKAKQQGAQVFEFAVMLPFLVLIMFMVVDFGILTYNKAILTNAAREAVRRGTVLTAATWNPAAVRQIACDYARSAVITVNDGTNANDCSGTDDPQITVTPTLTAPAFNDPVRVDIAYQYEGFLLGKLFSLGAATLNTGGAVTLTASTEMLHE